MPEYTQKNEHQSPVKKSEESIKTDNAFLKLQIANSELTIAALNVAKAIGEHTQDEKEDNELKAQAIMEFVNIQIGAFDANFVETNEVSLYSLYRFAQIHIMDNYNIEVESMAEKWGEEMESETRNHEESK